MTTTKVATSTQSDFKEVMLGEVRGVSIGSTGNAVATIALTTGPKWRLTQVTAWAPSGSCTSAIISVNTSSGGTGNLTDGTTALSSLSGSTKLQDLVLASGVSTSIQTNQVLYVKVGTAATGVTLNLKIYGTVLQD